MAGYIGSTPVPQGIKETQSFTATAGQTTFNTLGYSDGNNISVFLNGVRLINGTDYTATNGSDIVLTAAASASDVLDFETFNEFNLVNQNLTTPSFTDSVSVEGDGTFDTAVVTVQNSTKENTDGGRESRLRFRGFRSGDVGAHTLAEIQGSHDGTGSDQKGDLIFKTNDGTDNAAPTEAARINSSRVFMVGTTNPNPTGADVVGASIDASGEGNFSVDGAEALRLNRKSDNGAIVNFRKDGTTVGNIEVNGNDNIRIAASAADHAGLEFATHIVAPLEAGSGSNGTIDLGAGSARFKDLYLSGGVVFGDASGSGVSSETLDDYEEGTWTATSQVGSLTANVTPTYTKIGDLVTIYFDLRFFTEATSTDPVKINGLPYASKKRSVGAVMFRYWDTADDGIVAYVDTNLSSILFISNSSANWDPLDYQHKNGGSAILAGTITYKITP